MMCAKKLEIVSQRLMGVYIYYFGILGHFYEKLLALIRKMLKGQNFHFLQNHGNQWKMGLLVDVSKTRALAFINVFPSFHRTLGSLVDETTRRE